MEILREIFNATMGFVILALFLKILLKGFETVWEKVFVTLMFISTVLVLGATIFGNP